MADKGMDDDGGVRKRNLDSRAEDLSQGIMEMEAKSEAGLPLSPHEKTGYRKYNKALKSLIPIRKSNRTEDEFPLARAGCLSIMMFSWLTPTLWKIFKTGVDFLEEMSILDEDAAKLNSDRLERLWMEECERVGVGRASFGRAAVRFIRTRLLAMFVVILVFCAFSLCNPIFLINNFLKYLSRGDIDIGVGISFVIGILLCEAGRTLTGAAVWHIGYQSGLRVRSAGTSLLFKKILHLKSLKDKTVGELVNLVSNDGQRLFEATAIGPLVVSAPIVLLAGSIYSLFLLGAYGLIGCSIFLGFYPFSALISRLTTKFRREGIIITDKRVRMMTELLTCIKLIKMYAWEKPFAKTISGIRIQERSVLQKGAYVQSLSTSISGMVPILASVITFIVYVASGNNLTAATAFTYVALLNGMRFSLGVLPYAVKALGEISVTVKRYKSVLCMEEISPSRSLVLNADQRIAMQDATFSWGVSSAVTSDRRNSEGKNGAVPTLMNGGSALEESIALRGPDELTMLDAIPEPNLHDITFVLEKGKMLGVCGSVGSGKTSVISAILGRMDLVGGKCGVNGSIAYVSQQAWIMNSTVRENILFGLPYDPQRYSEVVSACALKTDFETLVTGDLTEIGERGINLSGGQKQRISLARAVYSNSEIYLLDDPLSAVDVHVGQHIVKECLLKELKGKTVVFVTHQLQYLTYCSEVMFMKDGRISEKGTHEQLMKDSGDYANLITIYYAEKQDKSEEAKDIVEVNPKVKLPELMQNIEENPDNKSPPPLERLFSRGASDMPGSDHASRKRPPPLERLFSRGAGMGTAPPQLERMFSRDAVQEGDETKPRLDRQLSSMSEGSESEADKSDGKLIVTEERDKGSVTTEIYKEYIKEAGGYLIFVGVMLLFILAMASQTGANWFLSYWLNQGSGNTTITVNNVTMISQSITDHPQQSIYTLIYGMFVVIMLILTCVRAYFFMKASLKASSGLHDLAFVNILGSPMEFFDTTPTGRIVNRFSSDMDEIDIRLPMQSEVFLNNILQIFFAVVMICYMSPWFLLAMIPLIAVFIFLFILFVRCARNIKRLDAITRSPLVSHITASVQGLSTIHAYGKADDFVNKFYHLMDRNSVPFFVFYSANRWLSVRLDLMCVCISSVTGLIIVLSHESITPAVAGLALSFAVQMTGLFQFTVRLAIETESRFTSVQRMQEYAKGLKSEDHLSVITKQPASDWPSEGRITYTKLKMRYREGMPLALKGVTFNIEPQEKIGIVGRSGSGKSSLGVALFRLARAASGSIVVDNIDISKIALHDLRSKLAIIPQDPVLFVGTVRYNLDPFSEHADVSLWDALEKCHVKDTIMGLDERLDAPVVENGENFSVGERQLICLARALLRHSKILMLDEATAAIDTETDSLVQATIKEAFADCTMLIIAHRLNTVLTCDRILVMEDGKVAEFDKPSVLMSRSDSKFKAMLSAAQSATAIVSQ